MSKPGSRPGDTDENEFFSDEDFDVGTLMEDMEEEDRLRVQSARGRRAAWQRLEDWREWRRLRQQIEDWDDWDV